MTGMSAPARVIESAEVIPRVLSRHSRSLDVKAKLDRSTRLSEHPTRSWVVGTLVFALSAVGSCAPGASSQEPRVSNAAVEHHIRGLIQSLPSGSRTRQD